MGYTREAVDKEQGGMNQAECKERLTADDIVWHFDALHEIIAISKDFKRVKIVEWGDSYENAEWVGCTEIEVLTPAEYDEYVNENAPDYADFGEESTP